MTGRPPRRCWSTLSRWVLTQRAAPPEWSRLWPTESPSSCRFRVRGTTAPVRGPSRRFLPPPAEHWWRRAARGGRLGRRQLRHSLPRRAGPAVRTMFLATPVDAEGAHHPHSTASLASPFGCGCSTRIPSACPQDHGVAHAQGPRGARAGRAGRGKDKKLWSRRATSPRRARRRRLRDRHDAHARGSGLPAGERGGDRGAGCGVPPRGAGAPGASGVPSLPTLPAAGRRVVIIFRRVCDVGPQGSARRDDRAVVVASDGILDVLRPDDVARLLLMRKGSAQGAAELVRSVRAECHRQRHTSGTC